jgi:hypothetical protein
MSSAMPPHVSRTQPYKATAIFVTYNMFESALRNIERFLDAVPYGKVILVDNSSSDYRKRERIAQKVMSLPSSCEFVESDKNCRFHAYNLALKKISEGRIVFRTDDDIFDENVTSELLDIALQGFATTPHVYDGQIQTPQGFQRPLETCIFDYQFLKEILPFKLQGGADWLLLQRAFNMQSVYEAQDVILYKARHGRNM